MDTVATLVKVGVVLNISSLLVIIGTLLYKVRSMWKFSRLKRESTEVFRSIKLRVHEVLSIPQDAPSLAQKEEIKKVQKKTVLTAEANIEIQKRLRKVEKLLTENDFEGSEKLLVEALGFDAEDEDVTTLLAFIYYKRHKLTKAENLYVSLIEKGTKEPGVYGNLAKVMEEQGKIDLALAAAKEAVKKDPYTAARYAYLGKLYASVENAEHAIDAYKEALRYATKNTKYMFALSKQYEKAEQYPQAIKLLQQILGVEPYNEEAKVRILYLQDKGYIE